MMEMELLGKRRRGRPKRRFLDVVKEDMGKLVRRRQMLKTGRFGKNDMLWLSLIEGKGRKKIYFEMTLCQPMTPL